MFKSQVARLTAVLSTVAAFAVCAPAVASDKQWPKMELTFSSALPAGGLNLGFEWWADELERRTGGAITTSRHYSASLMGALATLPGLESGRIEVGYMAAAYWPGEFPLWNVAGIPFQTSDPVGQVRTFYELYQENEHYRREWENNGVHLILLQPLPHGTMGLREPISGVSDLDGKRLRMVGYVASALQQVGVETVALRPEELYESIQRGVVDGYGAWPFDIITTSGLHEVAPYMYDVGYGHYASAAIGVSKRWWDSLDADLQALMTEIAEEFMFTAALPLVVEMESAACDKILESGGTVTILSDDQVAEFREKAGDASAQRWRAAAIERGVAEQAVDDFRNAFLAKYAANAGKVEYASGMRACAAR